MNFNTICRHRSRHTFANTAVALAAAALVAACGGGGGGDDLSPNSIATNASSSAVIPAVLPPTGTASGAGTAPPTPTVPTGIASNGSGSPAAQATASTLVVGRVTDATNLTVKRARYDASNASVRVDYRDSSVSEIKSGMIVAIEAEVSSSGTSFARSIAAHSFVEGRVDSVDAVNRTIVVNGVTVAVPADTVFDGVIGLTDGKLRVGASVEVHGYASITGGIATRIELKAQDDDSRITGTIANLNMTARTFTLYGKTISFGSAELDDLPTGLANGMLVRVKGIHTGVAEYTAQEVRSGSDSSSSSKEGSRSEHEGIVTAFTGLNDLVVNGMRVDASGAEVKGIIAAGSRVEVEGVLRNGVLVASKLENKNDDDNPGSSSSSSGEIELRGTVSNLNSAARTFQFGSTAVTWNATTEFDDVTATSLANGMFVEVEGRISNFVLQAEKIKLED